MIRTLFVISVILISVSTYAAPDCSKTEDFKSSVYGMLMSEMLAVNVDSPEEDAEIHFGNGDYRLLGYGVYSGIKIPGSELLENDEICEYGVKVFPGMTDAYESPKHRVLVEELKEYIKRHNAYILIKITNKF